MNSLKIEGGHRLSGDVYVSGAKNAVLPEIFAALLTDSPVFLKNVPRLGDVDLAVSILRKLSVVAETHHQVEGDNPNNSMNLVIDADDLHRTPQVLFEEVSKMRGSILTIGPLLARHGYIDLGMQGGCAIGERSIAEHIFGLEKMGAVFTVDPHGNLEGRVNGRLVGATIRMGVRSVTGTENIMMAATLAVGTTVIKNAAREPEIVDLAKMLTAMGAKIRGAGTDEITIEGVKNLSGCIHHVMPDRIEAATFIFASMITRSMITVHGAVQQHMMAAILLMNAMGADIRQIAPDALQIGIGKDKLQAISAATGPYPFFPTDMQAQLMATTLFSTGSCVILENIFENRFMHVSQMQKMGANLKLVDGQSVLYGPQSKLVGARVKSSDLRAAAALVIAGLGAEGTTVVEDVYHLDRGYQNMEIKLQKLGAKIERVKE